MAFHNVWSFIYNETEESPLMRGEFPNFETIEEDIKFADDLWTVDTPPGLGSEKVELSVIGINNLPHELASIMPENGDQLMSDERVNHAACELADFLNKDMAQVYQKYCRLELNLRKAVKEASKERRASDPELYDTIYKWKQSYVEKNKASLFDALANYHLIDEKKHIDICQTEMDALKDVLEERLERMKKKQRVE